MDFAAKFSAKIEEQLKKWEIPSASIAVVKDGQTLLAKGFGMLDNDKTPADADTLYMIASCSKAFTATAAAVLATEGKLDFDTPIVQYMPEFRLHDSYATEHLTVRDFLSHRSGLPRHEYAWYGTGFTRDELMSNLKHLFLTAPIRYQFQYSNFNYLIVGVLIEKISGMPFEKFLAEKLLKPLGMDKSVTFLAQMRNADNRALPFDHENSEELTGIKAIPFYKSPAENDDEGAMVNDPTAPAGCVSSCASDMVKWLQFNLNKGKVGDQVIVREDLMDLICASHIDMGPGGPCEPQRTMASYGLGWMLYSYRGLKMMEHGGNINGFTSSTCFVPALNLGVFVSLNMDVAMLTEAIVHFVIDEMMQAEDGNWFERMHDHNKAMLANVRAFMASFGGEGKPGTTPSHPIEEYAGTYEVPGYRRFLVTCEDGELYADFNSSKTKLKHHHYDTFATNESLCDLPGGLTITFAADPKGDIRTLSVVLGTEKGFKPLVFVKA